MQPSPFRRLTDHVHLHIRPAEGDGDQNERFKGKYNRLDLEDDSTSCTDGSAGDEPARRTKSFNI
jgi:hypothetical protein